jgi:hypothetical protein
VTMAAMSLNRAETSGTTVRSGVCQTIPIAGWRMEATVSHSPAARHTNPSAPTIQRESRVQFLLLATRLLLTLIALNRSWMQLQGNLAVKYHRLTTGR